jgi:uncharacterized membrane protein YccC
MLQTRLRVRVTRGAVSGSGKGPDRGSSGNSGWLTREKRSMLALALKSTIAAGLCYWLASLAGLQDGYWGSISAIIVLQSNVGSTVTASRDRLLGTLIGAGFGAAFLLLGTGLWTYLLAALLSMSACSLLGLKNSSRLAGVTVSILMLVHAGGSNWVLPLHRVLEVLLGIVVALALSTLVFPSRARSQMREGLADEYQLMGGLFEAVLDSVRGQPAAKLATIRKAVESAIADNSQLLAAARNEPGGERASVEALSLLHQYGRSLQDSLHALELAIESGPEGNGYRAQLEPELGELIADIHKGFLYVAGCIRRWRFHVAPRSLHLEADIAALEAKMASIRPTALEYSQEEIFRAYALQLHLKQLSRQLRSARIATSQAIGGEGLRHTGTKGLRD